MVLTILAGALALSVAVFLAWNLSRLKEPPGFAYVALLVFAAVPVVLLLKGDLSRFALETPEGKWLIKVEEIERRVEDVQRTTQNIGAAVARDPGRQQGLSAQEAPTEGTRVRIVGLSPDDAFYPNRSRLVGKTARAIRLDLSEDGWWSGTVTLDEPAFDGDDKKYTFYRVKVERLK